MNGCVAQQSRPRLPNCPPGRSDDRSQERPGQRVLTSELLTVGPSGGYLTHYSNRTPGSYTYRQIECYYNLYSTS